MPVLFPISNNFRAGPPVEAVLPNQNLVGKVQAICVEECEEGVIEVSYSVGNDGTEDVVDPVTLEIYGDFGDHEELLWTTTWTAGVRAGVMEASTTARIEGITGDLWGLRLAVDGGSDSTGSAVMEVAARPIRTQRRPPGAGFSPLAPTPCFPCLCSSSRSHRSQDALSSRPRFVGGCSRNSRAGTPSPRRRQEKRVRRRAPFGHA